MGGGSKRVTIGHWLKAYVHLVFSRRVNKVHQLIYGERTMWKGNATQNGTMFIDNLNLFGGTKADGGVQGNVEIMLGDPDQLRSSNMANIMGGNVSAYRQLFGLWFIDFTWSFTFPQFKSVWARVTQTTADWDNDVVWYPEKINLKRLKGLVGNYDVSVAWLPRQAREPQTISYKLQYRVVGTSTWADIVTGSFAGGESPATISNLKNSGNQTQVLVGGPSIAQLAGAFTAAGQGSIPTGSKLHVIPLMQDEYEWQAVKLSGDGEVAITSVVDSIPTYTDINPVHALYHVCTQRFWRMRWPSSLIDETTWRAVADTLYAENFGMSGGVSDANGNDMIEQILTMINGYFKPNFATNKIELHLMRDNYNLNDLTELNPSNSQLISHNQALDGADLVNAITVKYRDDDGNTKAITVHNLAAVQTSGGTVPTEQDYPYVRSQRIATMLANRDLRTSSLALSKMRRRTNRVLWNHVKGDVVRVSEPDEGIVAAAYRIADIKELATGEFDVELVQDVFGLSSAVYNLSTENQPQYDPTQMLPANALIIELPYWVVHFSLTEAERNALPEDYGYVGALVTRNFNGAFSFRYDLLTSLDNTNFIDINDGDYAPTGYLAVSLTHTATTFTVNSTVDMFSESFDQVGAVFAMIISNTGEELVAVDIYDEATRTFTVRRGILDTVPIAHPSGARVMVFTSASAVDDTQRMLGDLVHYKVIPVGNGAVLAEQNAPSITINVQSRATRPYPPGQFQINGTYYPSAITDEGDIVFTWAHRDRLMQTVSLVDYTEGSIGPELGTTYTIQFYNGATLLRQATGLTGTTYTYLADDIFADGDIENLTVKLFSRRDGLESWTEHSHSFTRPQQLPQVVSITSAGNQEGNSIVFTVTFNRAYLDAVDHDWLLSLGGGATLPDIGTVAFSADVSDNGDGTLAVPSETLSFTITVPLVADGSADPDETISITMGDITQTVTILDEA